MLLTEFSIFFTFSQIESANCRIKFKALISKIQVSFHFNKNGKIWFKGKDFQGFLVIKHFLQRAFQRLEGNLIKCTWFNVSLQIQRLKEKQFCAECICQNLSKPGKDVFC